MNFDIALEINLISKYVKPTTIKLYEDSEKQLLTSEDGEESSLEIVLMCACVSANTNPCCTFEIWAQYYCRERRL
jgi:hypothetical protein